MIMMKQKKVCAFNILVLTINTVGLYDNHLFMADLIMLKIYQYLHMVLL